MIIGKIRPSLYLCLMAIIWSGVSAATAGVSNYQGLYAVRFCLVSFYPFLDVFLSLAPRILPIPLA